MIGSGAGLLSIAWPVLQPCVQSAPRSNREVVMAIRIKSVTILDTMAATPINRLTDVLGMNVDKLNIRVEIDATTGTIPDEIELEIRVQEPTLRRAGKSSMAGVLNATAKKSGTLRYLATVPLASFGSF